MHTATAIGTGQTNTTAIVNTQRIGAYAAQLYNDLTLYDCLDWFLPGLDELEEISNSATSIVPQQTYLL